MTGQRRRPHPRDVEEHDLDAFERAGKRPEHFQRRAQSVERDQRRSACAAVFHPHAQALIAHADHAYVEFALIAHARIIGDRTRNLNRRRTATLAVSPRERLSACASGSGALEDRLNRRSGRKSHSRRVHRGSATT